MFINQIYWNNQFLEINDNYINNNKNKMKNEKYDSHNNFKSNHI